MRTFAFHPFKISAKIQGHPLPHSGHIQQMDVSSILNQYIDLYSGRTFKM